MELTNRHYYRVLRLVLEQPWAILPGHLAMIQDILAMREAGFRFSAEELADRLGVAPPDAAARGASAPSGGTIALVPVGGIIGHRASELRDVSSGVGTSTEMLSAQIRTLIADPSVQAIVLDVNSPGGGVFGVPEVAADLRAARAEKPIVAIANALAASAAYWIGASASEVVVTPSGQVGSIGVYAGHVDLSEKMAKDGVKTTLISAGKYKTEGNPFEKLSDEAKAAMQKQADAYYAMFTKDVARGRGVTLDAVRGGFGEGRVVNAADAVSLGMADRVGTLDAVLSDLATKGPSAYLETLKMSAKWAENSDFVAEISSGPTLADLAAQEEALDVAAATINANVARELLEREIEQVEQVATSAAPPKHGLTARERQQLRLRLLELGGTPPPDGAAV